METIAKPGTFLLLIIFFVAFVLKNIITKKRLNASIKGNSLPVNLMVIVSGTLYTVVILSIFSNSRFLINLEIFNHNFFKIAGLSLMLTGISLGIATLITMKDSWRVGIRQEQKTELIVNGFFRISRNPFFLSYIIFFLGAFFVFPSVILLISYFALIIVIHSMILDEEKYLERTHGDEYLNYKNSVSRYISLRLKK